MKLNKFSVIAYLGVLFFLYMVVTRFTHNPSIFLNKVALVIVCGGLLMASLVSFPWVTLRRTFHAVKKVMTDPPGEGVTEAREIVRLAYVAQKGIQNLEGEVDQIKHPFLKESLGLVLDGHSRASIEEILEKRMQERRDTISQDANVMLTLSKYAPALGLAATVLELVNLLSQMKSGAAGVDIASMGVGMASALAATFYGIIIGNMIFTPLSELILSAGENDSRIRELIADGVLCIYDKKHPILIGEILNSHIPIAKREKLTKGVDSTSQKRQSNEGGRSPERVA